MRLPMTNRISDTELCAKPAGQRLFGYVHSWHHGGGI